MPDADKIVFLRHIATNLWLVLTAIWFATSLNTKPAEKKQSEESRVLQTGVMVVGLALLFAKSISLDWLDEPVMSVTPLRTLWGLAITLAGLGFAVWARVTLGTNWSGVVTLKQGHTLVLRGPYEIVRHPIYTGLLAALAGSALQYGQMRSFLAVGVCGYGFWLKSQTEEAFMVERFGGEYLRYRQRVCALVPFIF